MFIRYWEEITCATLTKPDHLSLDPTWSWPQREGQSTPRQPPPRPEPRLQPINRNQLCWHAVDVERLVGPDHLVRAIWELVGRLDLSRYTGTVKAVEGVAGRDAYDPRLLISLWIYAYSQKIGSAREVARRCEYDPAFQWLTGLEVVNYHTLADFRVEHAPALDKLFAQLLGVLSSEGLVELGECGAGWHQGESLGQRQLVSSGEDLAGASGGGTAAGEGDGRSAARGIEPSGRRPASGPWRRRRWRGWNGRWRKCRRCKPPPKHGSRNRSSG